MYKNKPLIIADRPWWRHPVFPWGWYSLVQDKIEERSEYFPDGYYNPFDSGGGVLYWDADSTESENKGKIIQPTGITTGRWKKIEP